MSSKKRILIILSIVMGTPVLALCIGILQQKFFAPEDTSGIAAGFAMFTGIIASVGSLIFGPIVSFLMRNSKRQYLSLLGYILPSVLGLLYLVALPFMS